MADSLLNTVKQGSQLYKESGEAVSSLSSKAQGAGLPKAPSTPMEAAVLGGTPSQSKMAATPAAMQGQAQKIKLPPTLELATQQRRQQVDATVTAEQARANQIAQHFAGFGSFGAQVPALIDQANAARFQGVTVTPQVDKTQLATLNLSSQDQTTLTDNLNILKDPAQAAKHPDALVKVSQLTGQDLSKMDKTTLSATVDSFFVKAPAANLNAAVDSASPATVTLGMLGETPIALGYNSWDSLADDLGIKVPAGQSAADSLKKMTIKELGDTVDTMKRTGYSTQQEWMSVLQDPTSSLQDRQVARTMLTNMGASGVREAEQRTQTLVDQVQAGNTVTVNLTGTPQQMSVENALNNDAVKGAIKILLNPEDPAYKAVAAANPELLAWTQKNAAALQDQVKNISSEVSQFATQNSQNAKVLDTFAADDNTKAVLGKVLFPDSWGSVSSQKYTLDSAPLLKNWDQIPPQDQTQIKSAIQTIADGGTTADVQAFLGTNRDALKALKLDTPDGLNQFKNFWAEQKLVRSIGPFTNLTNPESTLVDLTGESSAKLAQDSAAQTALAAIGFKPSSGIQLPKDLNSATGLVTKRVEMADLLASGKPPVSLKDRIAGVNNEMQTFAGTGDDVTKAVATAILQKHGTLAKEDVLAISGQDMFKGNPAALRSLADKTGQTAGLKDKIFDASVQQVNATLKSGGLPDLSDIAHQGGLNHDKIDLYIKGLNQAMGSADAAIKPNIQTALDQLNTIKTNIAANAAEANKPAAPAPKVEIAPTTIQGGVLGAVQRGAQSTPVQEIVKGGKTLGTVISKGLRGRPS